MACTCRRKRWVWWDRTFAACLSRASRYYDQLTHVLKQELFQRLAIEPGSTVLEIGLGTGPNLAYYPQVEGLKIVGVDPNPSMAAYALQSADDCGLGRSHVQVIEGVAESLPLPDCSQDAVVCTLVLCSVEDPVQAVHEVKRVLKPGGRFLFCEHVAAPEGTWLHRLQQLINPVQRLVADGCNVNRRTWQVLEQAGFSALELSHHRVGSCPLLAFLSPYIMGIALK